MEDKNTVKNWKSLTAQALQEMHNHLKENCAGGYDLENKPWQHWLYEGYKQAQSMQEQVENQAGYDAVLEFYAAGFKDGHIRAGSNLPTKALWPGFSAYYKTGEFYINSEKKIKDDVPNDAKVISINGQPAKEWVADNVFKFIGNVDLQASWYHCAHHLFLDYKNPFVKRPVQCELESKGKILSIKLNWQPILKDEITKIVEVNHPKYKSEVTTFGENGAWVKLPTLQPKQKSDLVFLTKMTAKDSPLKKHTTIVFDIRGNGGGSAFWAIKLLAIFYKKETIINAFKKGYTDCYELLRATPFNLKSYENIHSYTKEQFGESSCYAKANIQYRLNPLKAALETGETWSKIIDEDNLENYLANAPTNESEKERQIYLLVSSSCGSASLIFADMVSAISNTWIVGHETNADTVYMENTFTKLVGGDYLEFPMVHIKNRKRASNQTYIPDYIYKGDIRNTKAVKQWVYKLIKENKAQ